MRVLWITNILFPEVSTKLSKNKGELKSSGGWMLGAADELLKNKNICLCVATVSTLVKELTLVNGERCSYYVLPFLKNGENTYRKFWQKVNMDFKPDVVHIHGTETRFGNDYIRACGNKNVVVSIQGLISSYYKYYYAGISLGDILRTITLRDILKGSIISGKKKLKNNCKYEIETIKNVEHIIGRTSWDRALTKSINPDAEYHFCNEMLRPEFYDGTTWEYGKCNKHTIFVSQATYPIKGLHQLIKAMPIILRRYPDARIIVAGKDIIATRSLKQRLFLTGYGNYLRKLIRKTGLEQKLTFVGNLNADEMKQEYLKSNVFVCPSSIENSPNSLGEAQILGVPCVASYVGGIMDMMRGDEENLYRFEEYEILAEKICKVFDRGSNHIDMRPIAQKRHNRQVNCDTLYNIYRNVCSHTSHKQP